MTIIEMLKIEFEKEAITTRKMLACIPDDKYDWQPHPKSMTVRSLSVHIAELPGWIPMTFLTDELDFEISPYTPKPINNTAELLAYFEECLADGRTQLIEENAKLFDKLWTLRSGEYIITCESKLDIIRMTMSQIIHHRAQLGVFLRLLDVPIPGSYGPSADEMG
jgi:uncharacterized damage-inducible protein DinB